VEEFLHLQDNFIFNGNRVKIIIRSFNLDTPKSFIFTDTTNSKNANHGKIAIMIEYLFSPKFIIKRLKWGEMNG